MSKYLEKYPWLRMNDPYPEENNPDEFDMLDCLPHGWIEAFGEFLCEDLDRVIKAEGLQDEFRIVEAKEKYGEMRIYCDPCTPAIMDVLRIYEACSQTICCHCGSIEGVKFSTLGWSSPYCRSCFQKINGEHNLDKFDQLPNEELPTVIKWGRFSKNCHENFEMDISETVEKIRENYKQRMQKENGEQ